MNVQNLVPTTLLVSHLILKGHNVSKINDVTNKLKAMDFFLANVKEKIIGWFNYTNVMSSVGKDFDVNNSLAATMKILNYVIFYMIQNQKM